MVSFVVQRHTMHASIITVGNLLCSYLRVSVAYTNYYYASRAFNCKVIE